MKTTKPKSDAKRRSGLFSFSRAFTLIELLVVIAMIAVLTAAAGSSVASAQRRAKISKAQTEAQELTKAIQAYANYTEDGSLTELTGLNDAPASESNLKYVLGKVTQRGSTVPVLYNASVTSGGQLLDPWGTPYRITVKKGQTVNPSGVPNMKVGIFYPNWHRVTEGE